MFVEGGAADDATDAGSISPVPSFRSPAWHSGRSSSSSSSSSSSGGSGSTSSSSSSSSSSSR